MASDVSPKVEGPLWKPQKLTKGQLKGETEDQHQKRIAREHLLGYRKGGPKTREYQRVRAKFLQREKLDTPGDWWRCDTSRGYGCGRLISTPEVDHVIKKSVRPDLVTVTSNFQILCHDCHLKKDSGMKFK